MALPQEAIDEYKQIYREEFGIELSDYDAKLYANNLMHLFVDTLSNDSKI